MWKTALALIIGIIIIPAAAFYFDEPLTRPQVEILRILVSVYLVFAILCFVVSSISKNYSQVDKLWSIMPIVYVWIVAFQSGFEFRILVMAILVSIWGLRLSFNFARRGGYSWKFWEGDEDYRWVVLRQKKEFQSPVSWMLFNLFFISLYQMGLILLFTLPILKSLEGRTWGVFDWVLTILMLGFIVVETIADQQQWNYQNEKKRLYDEGTELPEKFSKGFVYEGLWSVVRHPNYAAEQSIWIIFYLFSVVASGAILNWSVVGFILLILLFKGSADFSEGISFSKYPAYQDYIKKVPRFIPFLK